MADAATQQQTVAVEHLEQPVTSHIDTVVTLKHDLEFARPYARMAGAYVMHQAENHVFLQLARTGLIQMIMVGLPCIAKHRTGHLRFHADGSGGGDSLLGS